jgi:hypothetical protein
MPLFPTAGRHPATSPLLKTRRGCEHRRCCSLTRSGAWRNAASMQGAGASRRGSRIAARRKCGQPRSECRLEKGGSPGSSHSFKQVPHLSLSSPTINMQVSDMCKRWGSDRLAESLHARQPRVHVCLDASCSPASTTLYARAARAPASPQRPRALSVCVRHSLGARTAAAVQATSLKRGGLRRRECVACPQRARVPARLMRGGAGSRSPSPRVTQLTQRCVCIAAGREGSMHPAASLTLISRRRPSLCPPHSPPRRSSSRR